MDNVILIKITDDIDDLAQRGEALAQDVLAKCNYREQPIRILEVRNPDPAYYAAVDYDPCLAAVIDNGEPSSYITAEDYEKIIETSPDDVAEVEFEGEPPSCILY